MVHISPAECVIRAFGGVNATARAIGVERSAVSRWRERGPVPTKSLKRVLEKAKELGLSLTSDDLIHGREEPEGSE